MVKDSKKEMLGMSTITYKYQVTIPKKVRERFKLEEGDMLVFVEEDNILSIKKSTEV